ncbi:hypothetical protein FOMG_19189 [Fusarium oxysporum f. sp. melonis 26406]|uniref:Uncharacterized protein n=1 Tax=Fusarium oxysporum f. sp. melonis 26406 TaxID=1089452 RepID=W9Z656_FUSOX|nr:hypothetical protein FOMG_19189 [Fusarium oxysporum f. sp. melonis 26406]
MLSLRDSSSREEACSVRRSTTLLPSPQPPSVTPPSPSSR